MEEAELWPADTATPVVAVKTVYRALLTQGLRNFRLKRRPNINRTTALLGLKYYRDWR